ncbi:hypothetical protein N177_1488 [Lutibaculum baratangense AMV1]|uniref:Uncharacterized protein n=1 Tax=Lutibaculum baratangense AMV1 TaxID=631454 RepID=V4RR82_9HYPH|nr:hypothetical protein N177_1488 [Lutibaculum baratangense AMV1]
MGRIENPPHGGERALICHRTIPIRADRGPGVLLGHRTRLPRCQRTSSMPLQVA